MPGTHYPGYHPTTLAGVAPPRTRVPRPGTVHQASFGYSVRHKTVIFSKTVIFTQNVTDKPDTSENDTFLTLFRPFFVNFALFLWVWIGVSDTTDRSVLSVVSLVVSQKSVKNGTFIKKAYLILITFYKMAENDENHENHEN